MSNEEDEVITVQMDTYFRLMFKNKGWIFSFLSVSFYGLYGWAMIGSILYPGEWARNIDDESMRPYYLKIILLSALGCGVFCVVAFFFIVLMVIRAASHLHTEMMDKILHAPINLFFDKTPMGMLLNRFSKDLNNVDVMLPYQLTFGMECSTVIVVTFLVSGMSSYWAMIPVPFILLAGGMLMRYFIKAYTDRKSVV